METIKTILVACDLSEYTEPSIKLASEIASGLKAEILFVNVINQRDLNIVERVTHYTDQITIDGYVKETKEYRTDQFNSILKKLGLASVGYSLIYKTGTPYKEILNVAEQENAVLLVMGVRGNSDIEDAVFGSTAQKVFRRSPVPLLSVRIKTDKS